MSVTVSNGFSALIYLPDGQPKLTGTKGKNMTVNQWWVDSESSGTTYLVSLKMTDQLYYECSCIWWTRHVPRRDCKHILWVRNGGGEEIDPMRFDPGWQSTTLDLDELLFNWPDIQPYQTKKGWIWMRAQGEAKITYRWIGDPLYEEVFIKNFLCSDSKRKIP
jgi:hypothetical protein